MGEESSHGLGCTELEDQGTLKVYLVYSWPKAITLTSCFSSP